eukprot:3259564-Heterocapsa_arctica.AAC.1
MQRRCSALTSWFPAAGAEVGCNRPGLQSVAGSDAPHSVLPSGVAIPRVFGSVIASSLLVEVLQAGMVTWDGGLPPVPCLLFPAAAPPAS